MKKLHLIITIAFLLIIPNGCRFSYSGPTQTYTEDGLNTAKKSIALVQDENLDSLIMLFNKRLQKEKFHGQFTWLIENGKPVVDNYIFPDDSRIQVSQRTNYSLRGKQVIETFSLPFQNPGNPDSTIYFHITVSNRELYSFMINNFSPGIHFIEKE